MGKVITGVCMYACLFVSIIKPKLLTAWSSDCYIIIPCSPLSLFGIKKSEVIVIGLLSAKLTITCSMEA